MKIYSLVDRHLGEVLYTSIDKEMLQEIMCDEFFDAFQYECSMMQEEHFINMEHPNTDTFIMIKDCWNGIIAWQKECYDIQETLLI